MGGGNKSCAIKRQYGKIYNLYLVSPQSGGTASGIAEKLISISGVEEVLVTEGDCGFMVRAKANPSDRKVYEAIQSRVKGDLRSVTTYYRYKK